MTGNGAKGGGYSHQRINRIRANDLIWLPLLVSARIPMPPSCLCESLQGLLPLAKADPIPCELAVIDLQPGRPK